jgi:glycerophosphoryl diester phosphodiesterase
MNRKKILMLVVAIAMTAVAGAQTRVVAHRGYWKTEGSAQNSITSLKRVNDVGVYGTEFDVQLTADNRIVVNHDDSIQGYVIADTPYSKLKGLKLSNGDHCQHWKTIFRPDERVPDSSWCSRSSLIG